MILTIASVFFFASVVCVEVDVATAGVVVLVGVDLTPDARSAFAFAITLDAVTELAAV